MLRVVTNYYSVDIMKRKFKQWWSSTPPTSTKRTITSHLNCNIFCHYIINIRFTIVLYAIIISTVRAGLKIIFHQMIYKMDFPADILFFSPSALKFDVRFYLSERVIVQSCLTPIVHFSIYIIARTSINYMRMRW